MQRRIRKDLTEAEKRLNGYTRLVDQSKRYDVQIASVSDSILNAKSMLKGINIQNNVARTDEQIANMVEIKTNLVAQKFKTERERGELLIWISRLSKQDYVDIIRCRYIEIKSWDEIVYELKIAKRTAFKYRNEAVEEINVMMDKEK